MHSSGEFQAAKAGSLLKGRVAFDEENISFYPFKPFDNRLAYLSNDIQPLFSRPSPELLETKRIPGNVFFLTRDAADKSAEGRPFYFSPYICDYDFLSGHARHFPIFTSSVKGGGAQSGLFDTADGAVVANLSKRARAYLDTLGKTDYDESADTASLVWLHALAIGYAPEYLKENADGIGQDWPRIPLPADAEGLERSAGLGRQIAALLDTESPVPGVTSGKTKDELRVIGSVSAVGDVGLDESRGDFALTVGWGYGGRVTMPGRGKAVRRDYTPDELKALEAGTKVRGVTLEGVLGQLGPATFDVYLNEKAYWRNVPENVWAYTIGGYQVVKKWLSYREKDVLGRPLTSDEAREVTHMTRRIAALLLLGVRLDANYERVKGAAHP